MTGIKIEVEGDPIPLARARASKKGFYDPQFQAKQNFAWIVKTQYLDKPLNSALHVSFRFNFTIPKSWTKKKKAALLNKPHTQTPDTSNLIKFVEDALNKILWEDDSIISKIEADKRWVEKDPKTIIEIMEDI